MSELREVGDAALSFDGLFDIQDIYRIVDDFTRAKGYAKKEIMNKEIIGEDAKDILVVFQPDKDVTEYVEKRIKIVVDAKNVKEVEVTIDGKKRKMLKGALFFAMKAYIVTDWEGKWEDRGIYFFIRALYDKWIYRSQTKEFVADVINDMNFIKDQVRAYLNMQRERV